MWMLIEEQHVVGAGPFIGYCIFDNHEEVRKPDLGYDIAG